MSVRSAIRRPSIIVPAALALVIALVWCVTAIRAAQPPTLDAHVRALAAQVQVPGAFGDSAATSSLPVAQEMRDLIRQDLILGWSDRQILDYFRQRYGDGILETPPAEGFNALMWLPPVALAAFALYFLLRLGRQHWRAASPSLPVSDRGRARDADDLGRYRELLRRELAAEDGLGRTHSEGGRA